MKRIIKFRGKDIHTGKWVYGDLTHGKGIRAYGDKLTYDRVMVAGYEVDENTVGQFTGLCDRNGREIYEGDIVQHPYIDPIFRDIVEPKNRKRVTSIVAFHDGVFVVKYDENDFIFLDSFTRHGYVEVVGNGWDNPELLKGGEE